jgi:DNA-binding IclR family transcriptional regulator
LGTRDWTQVDVPTHCSSLGKVFLAWDTVALPAGRLERPTDATMTAEALRAEFVRNRKRGWATTVDELEVGLAGVAVPVLGSRGQVVAALGVSGPTQRLEPRFDELGRLLTHHAAELTELLRGKTASPITKEGAA